MRNASLDTQSLFCHPRRILLAFVLRYFSWLSFTPHILSFYTWLLQSTPHNSNSWRKKKNTSSYEKIRLSLRSQDKVRMSDGKFLLGTKGAHTRSKKTSKFWRRILPVFSSVYGPFMFNGDSSIYTEPSYAEFIVTCQSLWWIIDRLFNFSHTNHARLLLGNVVYNSHV